MLNLTKLESATLDILSKNFLSWILDAKIHLNAMNLGTIIKEGNITFLHDHAKILIFLHHYINEGLKRNFLIIKDPIILWKSL